MLQSPLLSLLRYTAPFLYRHLSARSFKINASRADPILAQTVLHVLYHVGAVDRVGKKGRLYLYRAMPR